MRPNRRHDSAVLFALLLTLASHVSGQVFRRPLEVVPASPNNFLTRLVHGDLDADGDVDFLTLASLFGAGGLARVHLNNGDGTFASGMSVPLGTNPSGAKLRDITGDGVADLVVATASATEISVVPGTGVGVLGTVTTTPLATRGSFDVADLDGDGDLDLVATGTTLSILVNTGTGFGPLPVILPYDAYAVAAGDYDQDGDQDIAAWVRLTAFDYSVVLLRNDGAFFFTLAASMSHGIFPSPQGVHWADLDGNGSLELIATSSPTGPLQMDSYAVAASGQLTLLGTALNSVLLASPPPWQALIDVNGDGWLDFVGQGFLRGVGFNLGRGDGTFDDERVVNSGPSSPTPGGAAADFDGDGDVDFISPAVATSVALLKNEGAGPPPSPVLISEIVWANPQLVELTNHGSTTVDLTQWTVDWQRDSALRSSTPLGISLAPGETALCVSNFFSNIAAPPGVQVIYPMPSNFSNSSSFCVALVDPDRIPRDEVHVADTGGDYSSGGLGRPFRGVMLRTPQTANLGSAERIWGLDSDSGADWTEQPTPSLGFESRSDGPRGTDPLPLPSILINETDDDPDYIELVNTGPNPVDLKGFTIQASARQNVAHTVLRPFPSSQVIPSGGFVVIGDGVAPPAEKPASVPYVNLAAVLGGNIPWVTDEYSVALYDAHGRVIDVMRTTGHDDVVTHNHPRAPAPPFAFLGAAPRFLGGDGAVGRVGLTDTNQGSDWRGVFVRSMGSPNPTSSFVGTPGLASPIDFRVTDGYRRSITMILNAGPAYAGARYGLFASYTRTFGQGPFFGLGADALGVYLNYGTMEPWGATLDSRGTWRFDLPPQVLPGGVITDMIAILLDPVTLTLLGRSPLVEWDS